MKAVWIFPVAALVSSGATHAATPDDVRDAVIEAVAGTPERWPSVPDLEDALVLLGVDAVDDLFELLVTESVPAVDDRPAEALGAPRRAALDAALERLPGDAVRDELQRIGRDGDVASRLVGLRVLANCGAAGDLALVARVATSGERSTSSSLVRAYGDAIARILVREPAAATRLVASLSDVVPGLVHSATRAIVRSCPSEAFGVLAGGLAGDGRAEPMILAELRRQAPQLARPPAERDLAALRRVLSSPDQVCVALAAEVVGQLEDSRAIPDLLSAIEFADPATRRALRTSLRRFARLDFGDNPSAWREWYEAQRDWLNGDARDAAADLEVGDLAAARRAIGVLATGRAFRHEVIELLLPGLERPEETLVVACVGTLAQLNAWTATPDLAALLTDERPAVRAAAHAGLIEITTLKLAPDAATWRHRLAQLEF